MKRLYIALVILFIVLSLMIFETFYCYKMFQNREQSQQILNRTYQLIQNENNIQINEEKYITKEEILLEDETIGILSIPKINVVAPIKDGTSQEIMKTSVGHFTESDYWNGNVAFASHNSGTSAHYFEDLNKLKINDVIEYKTKLGVRKYKVIDISKISSYDWSSVSASTNQSQNTITLITCINGYPKNRLCVKGIEI